VEGFAMNTANLFLRFTLELAALGGVAALARKTVEGWPGLAAAILAIGAFAAIWGGFNVPGDPSRSGRAPVPVTGPVRLVIEISLLTGGAVAWHASGCPVAGWIMGAFGILHYALSRDRLAWLVSRGRSG